MGETRSAISQNATRAAWPEHLIAVVACWPIAAPSLALIANTFFHRSTVAPIQLGSIAIYGLFALAFAGSLRLVVRRLTPAVAGIAFILVFVFAFLVIFDQDHGTYYLSVATASLGLALPWLFVAHAVHQKGQFLHYLYAAAIVILIAGGVRLYFPDPHGLTDVSYSQYAGYQMLPAVLIFIDDFLNRRRFRSGALAAIALVLLLGAGARGPLLAVLLYFVARAAVGLRRRPFTAVLLTALGVTVAGWLSIASPTILASLARLFAAQGLSTRAVDRLLAGSFLEDRTRVALVAHSWDLILTHPASGVGLARDRLLLAARMGEHDPEMTHGWYPHNIFLEFLVQWGVFVGGLFIVVLAALVVRSLLRDGDGPAQRVILIFVGIGLWPLLVSGSYLTSPHFFALVGFCLASQRGIIPPDRQRPRPAVAAG